MEDKMVGKQIEAIGEAPVAIIVGSESDLQKIANSRMVEVFKTNGIDYELHVISADRNPEKLLEYCLKVGTLNQTKLIIATAGLSAKLPAALASRLKIPVFGVPLSGGATGGDAALYAMLEQPKGTPVAVCGAIGEFGLYNAALIVSMIFANLYSGTGILFEKFMKEEKNKKPAIFNAKLPEPEGKKIKGE
jgi:5-(carboxyamino)imidazole ribonucleotide mutase